MIDNLKLAISENDMIKARKILKDELLEKNYPHEIFKDSLELAVDYNVFQEHDKEILSENPEEWTEEYLSKLKDGLDENFSKERFVKAYYISKKLDSDVNENNSNSLSNLKGKGKNFLHLAEGLAAAVGVGTMVYGAFLLNKKIKK